MNPYEILSIPTNATPAEIRKAYRVAAIATHPDRNPGDENAAERFRRVREAYEMVKDGHEERWEPVLTPNTKYGGADITWMRNQANASASNAAWAGHNQTRKEENKFTTPDQPWHPDYFK